MRPAIQIIGKTGQLALALKSACEQEGLPVVCLGRPELDLAYTGTLEDSLMQSIQDGSLVINAAAYTAVDKAEEESALSEAINAQAPAILARVCAYKKARLIHVSTDYVFGGRPGGPWSEDDEPCPVNAYGETKLAGEGAVLAANPEAAVVRTAAVFSHTGHNFLKTMVRISAKPGPMRIVDDQLTGPTPADQLAHVLLRLGRTKASGLFHASGTPPASWADFAEAILQDLSRRDMPVPGLERITTNDYPTPAARPANSVLNSTRLEKAIGGWEIDWQAGIKDALDRIVGNPKS